ncbi:MAG TPA: hypothetical protein VHB93_00535, partial [Candidatus Paceibacterota bacterium]|nr:hypothetical protein [Candidatus Paceibacterota bacterium]
CLFGIRRKPIWLSDCKGLGVVRKVQLVDHKAKPINTSAALNKGIATFLSAYHETESPEFNCYSFANLVAGIAPHPSKDLRQYWHTESLEEAAAGDTVFLLRDRPGMDVNFKHAAIKLNEELYISVYGGGGLLTISTLAHMIKDFEAEYAVLAIPK